LFRCFLLCPLNKWGGVLRIISSIFLVYKIITFHTSSLIENTRNKEGKEMAIV
jgi:hypothetical protein